ncbi:MAG: hypothetical protein ACE3JK_01525 [Sporolactobacillus sp.]
MFEWISAVEEHPQQPKMRNFYVGHGANASVRLDYKLVPKEIRMSPMTFEVDPDVYEEFREKCKRDGLNEDDVIIAFIDYYIKHIFD